MHKAFDYSSVPDMQRSYIQERASLIHIASKQTRESIVLIGQWLTEVKGCLPHGQWLPWLHAEFGWSERSARNYIKLSKLKSATDADLRRLTLPALYQLAAPRTPAKIREQVIARAQIEPVTRADVLRLLKPPPVPAPVSPSPFTILEQKIRVITLPKWKDLSATERAALRALRSPAPKFNEQVSDSIEWSMWSWNPVTGCLHNCKYCYARDLAVRFYSQKFVPSFLPERLSAPLNTTPPPQAENDIAWRNVFTCSMADLFGGWVPSEWIEDVLTAARNAPQWNFLFLTKFPQRLKEFSGRLPSNAWIGTTVDQQARVANAERAMRDLKAAVKWLSLEPLLEPVEIDFSLFDWVVIGGASKSTQTPEWKPPRKWVTALTAKAEAAGCAVYHKTNLYPPERLRNYPGVETVEPEVAPVELLLPSEASVAGS